MSRRETIISKIAMKKKDVFEGLVIVRRQGDRVDKVDDHYEYNRGHHENLDLSL